MLAKELKEAPVWVLLSVLEEVTAGSHSFYSQSRLSIGWLQPPQTLTTKQYFFSCASPPSHPFAFSPPAQLRAFSAHLQIVFSHLPSSSLLHPLFSSQP